MIFQYFLPPKPSILRLFAGLATAIIWPISVSAALPHVESQNSYILLVAALGDTAEKSVKGSTLKGYRVKRPAVEDYEFTNAVLSVMQREIDANGPRDKAISKINKATPGQKALYAVQLMRATVSDVGFIGYFESAAGNFIPEVKRGLKVIGAEEYLELFTQALKIFDVEKNLITDARNRKSVLSRFSNEDKFKMFDPLDQRFEKLEDSLKLQTYMIKYVNSNPRHFFVN